MKIGFIGGRGARESGRVVTRDFVREISILQLAKISQREVVRTLNKNKVDQGHLKFVTDYFNSDPESPWIEIYSAIERNEKWREKYFRNTPYSSEALNHKRSRIRIRSVVDYLWVKLTQSSGQMHSFTKHLKYVEERTIGSSDFKREAVDTIIRFHNDLVGVDYPVESSSIETPEFVIETQKTGKELTVYYRGDRVGYLSYSMMNGSWAVKIGPLGYVEAEPSFQVSEFDKSIEIVNEIHRYVGI
ncbi:hypothetical protein [Glutamicibacter arilaitensis]|uniref:hypothetical protein n=1 Tax=Glutamicibacter arilaitensis TaxID=256701 RepID=UPI003F93B785